MGHGIWWRWERKRDRYDRVAERQMNDRGRACQHYGRVNLQVRIEKNNSCRMLIDGMIGKVEKAAVVMDKWTSFVN